MTAPPNHITMMQIDCEVTNTQLLHVKKGDIPEHMRQPNATNRYSNSTSSSKPHSKVPTDDQFTTDSHRPTMNRYRPYFVKPNRKKFVSSGEFPSDSKLDIDYGPYNITSKTQTNTNDILYSQDINKYGKQRNVPRYT